MTLRLRELTDDERTEVQRITRSHTLGAALVRRAQIVVHAMSGLKAEEIARRMALCGNTVRYWINRFNARGLDGLEEDMRRSRISEIFIREGLKWRHDETWFGERVDPDFAKKRGSSSSSTPRRRLAA
jgi:transposase-like protein